jgi:hypothetical protein
LDLEHVNLRSEVHLPSLTYPKAARACGDGKTRAERKTKSKDMDGAIS